MKKISAHSERERKRRVQARRRKEAPHVRWYTDRAWAGVRARVLAEEPECVYCGEPSAVVDHIEPHRGDRELFFARSNLQGVCKSCHDRKTARQDGGFGNARRDDDILPGCDEAGRPLDPRHPWRRD